MFVGCSSHSPNGPKSYRPGPAQERRKRTNSVCGPLFGWNIVQRDSFRRLRTNSSAELGHILLGKQFKDVLFQWYSPVAFTLTRPPRYALEGRSNVFESQLTAFSLISLPLTANGQATNCNGQKARHDLLTPPKPLRTREKLISDRTRALESPSDPGSSPGEVRCRPMTTVCRSLRRFAEMPCMRLGIFAVKTSRTHPASSCRPSVKSNWAA